MHDAAHIAAMLASRADLLARELLPGGHREGTEWRAGSLAGEAGQSLGVRIAGARKGVWADFGGSEKGDALDLVAAVLFRGDKRAALDWSRRWLGLGDGPVPVEQRRAAPAVRQAAGLDDETTARQKAARRLFLSGVERLAGTPVADYLDARGIDLAALGRQPRALRFHPSLPNKEACATFPAMLAAVNAANGEHVATHRTWLNLAADGRWRKAPLKHPKMSLGTVAGGCIPLWRGASGKPLAKALPGETVVIGEGIETGLSVALACPELRVLSAVSLSNMGGLTLPAAVTTVILAADRDDGNEVAAAALGRAAAAYQAQGRVVRIARPPAGFGDFNDLLTADVA
jgi:hypothetical protein